MSCHVVFRSSAREEGSGQVGMSAYIKSGDVQAPGRCWSRLVTQKVPPLLLLLPLEYSHLSGRANQLGDVLISSRVARRWRCLAQWGLPRPVLARLQAGCRSRLGVASRRVGGVCCCWGASSAAGRGLDWSGGVCCSQGRGVSVTGGSLRGATGASVLAAAVCLLAAGSSLTAAADMLTYSGE